MPSNEITEPPCERAASIEPLPNLLTVAELVPLLGISRTTVYEMVTKRQIPHLRIGMMIRFDPGEIARWLRLKTVGSVIPNGKSGDPGS